MTLFDTLNLILVAFYHFLPELTPQTMARLLYGVLLTLRLWLFYGVKSGQFKALRADVWVKKVVKSGQIWLFYGVEVGISWIFRVSKWPFPGSES